MRASGVSLAAVIVCMSAGLGACSTGDDDNDGDQAGTGGTTVGTGGAPAASGSGGMSASGTGGAGGAAGGAGGTAGGAGGSGAGGTGTSGAGGAGMAEPDGGVPNEGDGGMLEETCDIVIPPSTNCMDKLAPGDERTCMLGSRTYIVHAGTTMNPCKPVALVLDAHGFSETAIQQQGKEAFCSGSVCWNGLGSGFQAESDTPGGGFIVVFPQGENNAWSASDADFMLDIVDEMKKLADIDPDKIYMTGISNGGSVTYQTACPHSDVFRGAAPHSGGSDCTSLPRPLPLIAFEATGDFGYDANVSAMNTVVSLNHCVGEAKPWITIDKTGSYQEPVCRTAKEDTMATLVPCSEVTSFTVEPTVCKIWDECDEGVKVAFCEVAPNTEHNNGATDAHIIYENNTILNTPSVAWRFWKMFWK